MNDQIEVEVTPEMEAALADASPDGMPEDQADPGPPLVDGRPARVVNDPPPQQPPLILVQPTEVLRTIMRARAELDELERLKKKAAENYKNGKDRFLALVSEPGLGGYLRDVGALPLTPADDHDDGDDEDDEDAPITAAEAETALGLEAEDEDAVPELRANETAGQWLSTWEERMAKEYGPRIRDAERGRDDLAWLQALSCHVLGPVAYDELPEDGIHRMHAPVTRAMAASWERSSDNWPGWIVQG